MAYILHWFYTHISDPNRMSNISDVPYGAKGLRSTSCFRWPQVRLTFMPQLTSHTFHHLPNTFQNLFDLSLNSASSWKISRTILLALSCPFQHQRRHLPETKLIAGRDLLSTRAIASDTEPTGTRCEPDNTADALNGEYFCVVGSLSST